MENTRLGHLRIHEGLGTLARTLGYHLVEKKTTFIHTYWQISGCFNKTFTNLLKLAALTFQPRDLLFEEIVILFLNSKNLQCYNWLLVLCWLDCSSLYQNQLPKNCKVFFLKTEDYVRVIRVSISGAKWSF